MRIRKDQFLTAAIVGVILVTFLFVVFLPQRRDLKRLHQERDEAVQSLDRDKEKAKELAKLRGDVRQMEDRLSFFDQRLPDQQELGEFLRDVSRYAQFAGLKQATFQPRNVSQSELHLEMPIDMKFTGRFLSLCNFLRQTKSMTRLTHVQTLTVSNDKDLKGDCGIELVMTIYFTRS
ncbi:MAG: hypothetical protein BIFFINMI_01616 [Phycisphaerae bacterium]|nr:hypothetical protein [Phycisphaerae bacterium]